MSDKNLMPIRCLRGKQPRKNRSFNIATEFECLLENENTKPWTRKIGHYHPSSIKGCKRSMYYDRIGAEPRSRIHADLRMLFDMGHALHDMIQEYFSNIDGFESEVAVEFPDLNIYGHCDGVFRNEDWVLEIKTVGETVYRTLVQPKIEHIWQIHCYMFALDIPRTQLLYVNRATGTKRLFKVEFSNEIWEEITGVIGYVEDHVERDEPPPQEIDKYKCRSCKFYHVCEPDLS
jgi:CRISPR/Cas system-associated exonuclease Cas4 (RecB family)